MPSLQRSLLDDILNQLRKLDLDGVGNIKTSVANIRLLGTIKSRLTKLVLNDQYVQTVKDFVDTFNEISTLQNLYWKSVESTFSPKPLLREIRIQAIGDTVNSLTEAGIGPNISDEITAILRTNITAGGSYKSLEAQLRKSLVDTTNSDGLLTKYAKQITTDSINQYSAQYTQAVSNDLGYEWFAYQGSDIKTTRPFCFAMTEFRYFHVSEVPKLLSAVDLYYTNQKTGQREKVPIYQKTGLPQGMIEGTNAQNFFINRGGYNCEHQIRPVSERLVPQDIKDKVFASPEYHQWKLANP